jgi:hypothetical protein
VLRAGCRVESGIPGGHLRAWGIAREEVLANVMRWIRLVIANFFAFTGKVIHEDRLLHTQLPDALWNRIRDFLEGLSHLPCWVDSNLSTTVFGPKQNLDYWEEVFKTGKSPSRIQILTAPLDRQDRRSLDSATGELCQRCSAALRAHRLQED